MPTPTKYFFKSVFTAIFLLIVILMFFSNCTTMKHTQTTKSEDYETTDSNAVTTTTTTEKSIAPVIAPADSAEHVVPLKQLLPGVEVKQEIGNMELTESLDAAGNVKFKAKEKQRTIDVPIDRTIISKTVAAAHQVKEVSTSSVVTDKQKEGWFKQVNLNYLWWPIGAIAVLWFCWFLWKLGRDNAAPPSNR